MSRTFNRSRRWLGALMAITTGGALVVNLPVAEAAASAVTFSYTGLDQTWTVPAGVSAVRVEAFGAQGGGEYGGFGAGVVANVAVTAAQRLTVRVGGRGGLATGGFNGGGGSSFAGAGLGQGQGGGGASDLSLGDSRLVVSGGGGGAAGGPSFGMGGSAGGTIGEAGVDGSSVHHGGGGGTSVQAGLGGGAFAGGGNSATGGNGGFYGGGGGGGWYGGGGGGGDSSGGSPAGGGAGSSRGPAGATFVQGARTGNGEVRISWGVGTPAGADNPVAAFAFTGGSQLFQVPAGVTAVDVRAKGAQGGTGTAQPGLGADVSAEVPVTPGQVLAVLVGGRGGNGDGCGALSCGEPVAGNSVGGFNGGGSSTFAGAGTGRGTGGGGATDLRRGSWRLDKRIVVAGGGGGSAVSGVVDAGRGRGGDASGPIGNSGGPGDGQYTGGAGGSQSAGGAGGGAYAGAGRALDGGSGGFFGGSGGGGWFGGGGGGGDSSGGSPGGGGAGSSHVTDAIGDPAYASNTAGGDGQLSITATAADPDPTPTPTAPGSVVLTPATAGELRVGSIWKVTGTFGKPLRSYAWLRCTSLDPTTCTRMAGATAATYRTRIPDLSRFIAVDVTDTDGNTGRSEPRFIQENVCKVPIEFKDGAYYKTRTRASTTITPRPGWGCLRINMFIAAKYIDILGYGNDRGPSSLADATASKGSIWVNFETGRIDTVANHTDTRVASFNAFPVNVTKNADSGVADALVRCVRAERSYVHLDKSCQARVYETFRKANSAGFYFPSTNTSGNFRIRYHFTNAARRYVDTAPAAIDGIFGFSGTSDGRVAVSCAFIDKFPSIEIYQDWPSPKAGGAYTMRDVFYRKESSPRDLNASAPKFSSGKCGRIPRPTTRTTSLERLSGVIANIDNKYFAPIGPDPYEDVMRDYKTWSPM
ncbi:hypothetical protein FB565_006456 [Actinoplanes lutulentus]|uniref:receptor protein-tyrosine kinase n=1 Tax=Actinoplanes lutulentus TaxID=1287878 RepID=A0A327ZHH4_9ACTN|nr:glycine-rich protein [Actinoplanes lutulentus]MBB2946688.1 hypothetical protein [Actinoplanes lutulentus]RAK35581.1 glycine rich protein [Actinoplanes lutulentus]